MNGLIIIFGKLKSLIILNDSFSVVTLHGIVFQLSSSSKNERKNLAELDEGELFMELIKDVANELDIDVLCHKILVNVGLLTHADRGSLFLVKGNSSQSRYLEAKLFDVTQDTGKSLSDSNALHQHRKPIFYFPFGT